MHASVKMIEHYQLTLKVWLFTVDSFLANFIITIIDIDAILEGLIWVF